MRNCIAFIDKKAYEIPQSHTPKSLNNIHLWELPTWISRGFACHRDSLGMRGVGG